MRIRNSLSSKIIILILIVIIPLLTFLYLDNYYGMSLLRKQVAQANNNLLSVYMSQLDDKLVDITNYLKSISKQEFNILNYRNKQEALASKSQAEMRIINRLSSQTNYNTIVDLFFLYSEKDDSLLLAPNNIDTYDINLLKDKIEGVIFVLETIGNKNWQLFNYYGDYKLIKVVETGMGTYLGAWISLESLIEPLRGINLGENGGIHIITENGFPLISTFSTTDTREIFNRDLNISNNSYRTVKDIDSNERFLMMTDTLASLPIDFIAMLPEKEIFKNLLVFRRMIYYIPLLGIFILLIYLILIRRVLFNPMKKLISAMVKVSQGDLDIRLTEDSSYEFNFLYSSFNNMIERVQTLKMNIYEEEIQVQKAELKHLQSQIKPHFFLNSLNIVYNLAVLKDFDSIKQMILYLGNYLRFTLKNEDKLVPLEEELNHIENYLKIQKLRFVDRFSYNIKTEEEYSLFLIPPLTIQPFVENSIIHGYNRKVDMFKVEITINIKKDNIVISIADNGKGFSPVKLLELQGKNFNNNDGEHIGIWNVYRRLNINYGQGVDLKFHNRDSGGSVVTIIIPKTHIKEGSLDNV